MTVRVIVPSWLDKTHGYPALEAFVAGLENKGVPLTVCQTSDAKPGIEPMVCWGVEKTKFPRRREFGALQEAQRSLGPLVILERGFVKREEYYSVGLDDIAGRGRYPHDDWDEIPGDRWEALGVDLQPWRQNGDYNLLIGQVPWDTSCQHVPHAEWVRSTYKGLQEFYPELPVVFRPHPLQPGAVPRG